MNLTSNKVDTVPSQIANDKVIASEYNQIAGSLMTVQNAAGLTPDASDNTQLLTAIKKLLAAPLFNFIWVDYTLNDERYAEANSFSWQSNTDYPNAYNHLVNDINGISASTETIGETTITYYRATDGHKIVLADQETNVSTIYNETGVAWYYVLDTTNTRFKLPRTKFGFTGLRDTVGKYVTAGAPNITGTIAYTLANSINTTGAFSKDQTTTSISGSGSSTSGVKFGFDASRSSAIYGNSTTIQPPATQMYLYFYVN